MILKLKLVRDPVRVRKYKIFEEWDIITLAEYVMEFVTDLTYVISFSMDFTHWSRRCTS